MSHKRTATSVVVLNMVYEFATEDEANRFLECVKHQDEKTCAAQIVPVARRQDEAQHPLIPSDDGISW